MSHSISRIPSSLDRSMELLSMERELQDLLANSQLTFRQKEAFQEMLLATFDLLQAPLSQDGTMAKSSLIDSSSIALYSKMQELVSALAALIMNEEDMTRMEDGFSRLDLTRDIGGDQNDSAEFSDDDGDVKTFQPQPRHELRRSFLAQPSTSSGSTPRLPMKSLYLNDLAHQPSRESLRSPSFSSPKLPQFPDHRDRDHREHERIPSRLNDYPESASPYQQDRMPLSIPKRHGLQVMNTPIPRSFSGNLSPSNNNSPSIRSVTGKQTRPSSMYNHSSTVQRSYNPNNSFDNTVNEYSHVEAYDPSVGYRSRRNSAQFSWSGSQAGTPGKSRKRYSMRF